MAVSQAAMRRRARIMRAVNVPMRAALSLPFATPLSANLMLDPAELERLLSVIAEENPAREGSSPSPAAQTEGSTPTSSTPHFSTASA
jgi:hypothetical protein